MSETEKVESSDACPTEDTSLYNPQPLQAVTAALGGVANLPNSVHAFESMVQGLDQSLLLLCGQQPPMLTAGGVPPSLMQPELRHIRSSPLQMRPSIFDQPDTPQSNELPPPVPLDPMQRSSSTPSSFRESSINSSIGKSDGRSAFTMPRVNYTSSIHNSMHSAFSPAKYYAMRLEDMERTADMMMERTSIEVMNMPPTDMEVETASASCSDNNNDNLPSEMEFVEPEVPPTPQHKGAAAKAVHYLQKVSVLGRGRRRRKQQQQHRKMEYIETVDDSSSNKPSSEARGSSSQAAAPSTSITVVTEAQPCDDETNATASSSHLSALHDHAGKGAYHSVNDRVGTTNSSTTSQYQQLEDMDEGPYHPELQASESPALFSSSYQPFVDERTGLSKLYDHSHSLSFSLDQRKQQHQHQHNIQQQHQQQQRFETLPSPSPTRMATGDASEETESPVTLRSSVTGSSSGHTTQATSIGGSSMGHSGLSTISETDREVMEANQKRRRSRIIRPPSSRKSESDATSIHSGSTNSSGATSHRYVPLGNNSPVPLREGATAPVEQFFQGAPPHVRSSSSQMSRSQSGNTASHSTTGTHTTSSSSSSTASSKSSSRDGPLNFVSYKERLPELMSVRETVETSSPRTTGKDGEHREASPAEMGEVLFEEAIAPRERKLKVNCPATNQRIRLDTFRRLPPRSPYRIPRSASTPSPQASSPLLVHPSPPRQIVDSRPNVSQLTTFSRSSRSSSEIEDEEVVMTSPKYAVYSRNGNLGEAMVVDGTCRDTSIEIMNVESTDDMDSATSVS